ncbi:hypothetical protein JHK87_050868 [Glycine soja]|nr:hypothetical protein JHK87_050868 [Glycine soja]
MKIVTSSLVEEDSSNAPREPSSSAPNPSSTSLSAQATPLSSNASRSTAQTLITPSSLPFPRSPPPPSTPPTPSSPNIYVLSGSIHDVPPPMSGSSTTASTTGSTVIPPCVHWERVGSPTEVREKWMHASTVVGERIYAMADRGGIMYELSSD